MRWRLLWLVATLVVKQSLSETTSGTNVSQNNTQIYNETINNIHKNEKNIDQGQDKAEYTKNDESVLLKSGDILATAAETPNSDAVTRDDGVQLVIDVTTVNTVSPTSERTGETLTEESTEEISTEINSSNLVPETDQSVESIVSRSTEGADYIIQTSTGPVKGHVNDNADIVSYIDIPYGKIVEPFDPPTEAQSWEDIHEKSVHDKLCPQLKDDNYVGDLDCLTLSIFTPAAPENASVLFHIHDPSFGSADPSIYGPQHLVTKGIMLVIPNYRIGVLGFLCLQNETAPGNAGLKDLSLALKWVKENIVNFGGNPSNIVVSGDGVGGAYAGYLALYKSEEFIKKAITESGSVLSPWALDRNPLNIARALAAKIREENKDDLIYNNTFAEVDITTIVKATKDMSFNPCLEADRENTESFMKITPWETLHKHECDITFMSGSAGYAGAHEALQLSDTFIDDLNEDFALILPEDLHFKTDEEKISKGLRLKEQYFGTDKITSEHLDELSLCYTDASYLGPVTRFARSIVEGGGKVFLYEFRFVGKLNKVLEALNRPVQGPVRSDIVGYLFKQEGSEIVEDSPESQMIDVMVELWTSFIEDGTPTAPGLNWTELVPTDETKEEWLLITSEPMMAQGVHLDRLQLWTSLYNDYYIERNAGISSRPNYLFPLMAVLISWISNSKFNYCRH